MNKNLTPAQRDVMLMLDGRTSPLELNGTYTRVVNALKDKGMVNVRRSTRTIAFGPARGSHQWNTSRVVLTVTLTKEGSDFIYNGGLDK